MNPKHREIMLRTYVARGMSQSQAEELYAKTYGKKEPVQQPVRNAPAVPVVAAAPAKTTAKPEAPADNRTQDTVKFSLLDRIQAVTGPLRAYDGRYCVWGSNGSFDVRDVANRLRITMHDVIDALPDFKPAKRGRASDEDEAE